MNILVLSAHPDDEAYGLGGTIAKHSKNGDSVYVLFASEGMSVVDKSLVEVRKKCARDAAKILGVKELFFLDYPDQKLDTIPRIELNKKIEEVIRKVKPEIVYTHSYKDANLDHRIVFDSTMVAVRPVGKMVKKVYTYEVLSSTEWGGISVFSPNSYEDVDGFISAKLKAVKAYHTEIREYPHPRSEEGVKILAQKRGLEVGLKFAEGFELVREIRADL